jgi:putative ABC transport system permease protein
MSGKTLRLPWNEWQLFPILFLAATIIGLLAGLYPSFYLSSFKPIQVLKGNVSLGSKNATLRSTLVVFQFATTIMLLIGTAVVYQQMKFIMNKKLGFDKDQVVIIQGTNVLGAQTASLKNELLKLSHVKAASVSDFLPVSGTKRNGNGFWKEGKEKTESQVSTQIWTVDDDYIKTLGINLIAGRNFSKTMPTDSQSVIINKSMAEKLGLENPVGQRISNGWAKYLVIGMVEDFHYESMKQKVEPLCLLLGNSNDVVSVKIDGANTQQALADIKAVWKDFSPNQAMRYSFLDERFAAMYRDVERTGVIFTSFSVLAIIVACLGLFALAAFMAEQRRKEIGIRKVVGASMPRIVALLSKNFLLLILIAFAVAAPLAWWGMTVWLQDFSYRAPISWWIFPFAALVAVLIGLITVSSQAIKAAVANPINSLRTE